MNVYTDTARTRAGMERDMFTRKFWKQAAERAVKTFAQGLLAVLAAGATGIMDTDWGNTLSVAGLAAVLSLLTSVVTSAVGEPDSPSAVSTK